MESSKQPWPIPRERWQPAQQPVDLTLVRRLREFLYIEPPRHPRREAMVKHLVRMIRYCDEVGVDFAHAAELALAEHLAEVDPACQAEGSCS